MSISLAPPDLLEYGPFYRRKQMFNPFPTEFTHVKDVQGLRYNQKHILIFMFPYNAQGFSSPFSRVIENVTMLEFSCIMIMLILFASTKHWMFNLCNKSVNK